MARVDYVLVVGQDISASKMDNRRTGGAVLSYPGPLSLAFGRSEERSRQSRLLRLIALDDHLVMLADRSEANQQVPLEDRRRLERLLAEAEDRLQELASIQNKSMQEFERIFCGTS